MKVLVSGSHGLVGSHFVPFMTALGHKVVRLVRQYPQQDDIVWNPSLGEVDARQLEGFDAVLHLAGESIASGRWTTAKKAMIRSSRVDGTKLLSEALASVSEPPKVLVSASAIGYYGNRRDEVLTEESSPGSGFLADVCRDWESATEPARMRGIRVANLRLGVVLSPKGGALQKMLLPFQMGAGGRLGTGKQYMSWISLEDLVAAIRFVLMLDELQGPINVVAPHAVTNNQFTQALGRALRRPTIFPVPGFAAHLLLGDMADELLLSSALVKPTKLMASGFTFRYEKLEFMLMHILNVA